MVQSSYPVLCKYQWLYSIANKYCKCFNTTNIPDATTPNNIIALAWDDLVIDPSTHPGCYVRYFVNGTAPNRVMVVDYYKVRFLGGSDDGRCNRPDQII